MDMHICCPQGEPQGLCPLPRQPEDWQPPASAGPAARPARPRARAMQPPTEQPRPEHQGRWNQLPWVRGVLVHLSRPGSSAPRQSPGRDAAREQRQARAEMPAMLRVSSSTGRPSCSLVWDERQGTRAQLSPPPEDSMASAAGSIQEQLQAARKREKCIHNASAL